MKDIKITENNTFEMRNYDFVLVDGGERVKQHIKTGLVGILPGTWLLDAKAGIRWFSGLAVYTSILKAQIKKAIREVEGVSILREFKFDDSDFEHYKVTGTVLVENENLNFKEDIAWR